MSKPVSRARAKAVFERNTARVEFRKIEKEFFGLLDDKITPPTGDAVADIARAERKLKDKLSDLCRLDTLVRIYGDGK